MEDPVVEKEDKEFTITTMEMIRFIVYTLIFFVIVFLQIRVETRFISNQNIEDHFFQASTNIFKQDYIGRREALLWIDQQLYKAYNFNSSTLGITFHEIIPITKLRITSTMIERDYNTGLWDKDMKNYDEDIGLNLQYNYNSTLNAYQLFFLPYSVLQFKNSKMGLDNNYMDYEFNNLKLIEREFLNSQTNNIKIDAAFYNGNINFVVVLQIEIDFSQQGFTKAKVDVNSFIANAYITKMDKIRMYFELIFLVIRIFIQVFYAGYCLLEVLKIKAQIKRAFEEDAKLQISIQRKKEKVEERQKQRLVQAQNLEDNLLLRGTNQLKSVSSSINNLNEIQKKVQERIQRIKNNILLVVLGLRRHISDVWSALDVISLILIAIAIDDWIISNINSQVLNYVLLKLFIYFDNSVSLSHDFNSYFLGLDIDSANQRCIEQSVHTKRYRILVAVSGLIKTTRLIKYFIFVFAKFNPYQLIILNVFKYMVSFMIILIVMILTITQFVYFYYGGRISEFSNFYDNLNYIFGMILGVNDNLNDVFAYDTTLTLVVQVLFFLLISSVMLNMFYIFVICEFAEYDTKYQAQILDDLQNQREKIFKQQLIYKHPLIQFHEIAEYLILQFWFSLTLKRPQFKVFMDKKEQNQRLYEREFTVNTQIIDFDCNFRSGNAANQDKSIEGKNQCRFLLEEEKKLIVRNNKMELVQLIWRTFILLILLFLNFLLVQQFYSPQQAYDQNTSLKEKIMFGGQSNQFGKIRLFPQVTNWIQDQFPSLFVEILVGKRELQDFYSTPEPFTKDQSQTEEQQLKSYLYDEFQFESLNIATSLNFFNLVTNNLVRITVRKSQSIENPDKNFKLLYPKIKTFFPVKPFDQKQSVNEQKNQFSKKKQNSSILEVDYSPTQGWGNSGGYNLICEVQQAGHLVKNLVDLGFLDYTTATITLEMVTINPVNKGCLAYIVIHFVINQAGIVDDYGVDVSTIRQNQLKSNEEVFIILLTLLLFIYLCYHFYKTLNTLRIRNLAYEQWHQTYIALVMSKAQIHFRHRHNPEFIRKWTYLLDVSQILSFIYLALMGAQIALIILSFFKVNLLLQAIQIFDENYGMLFNLQLFNLGTPNDYLATANEVATISYVISLTASLAILVLCMELLYLLSNNKEFSILTKSILYSFNHLPYVLIILLSLIISFTIMGYLMMGPKQKDFSSFYNSTVLFSMYVYNLESMKIFKTINRAAEFFLIALPFIITARFIIVNMFFAIIHRAFKITKQVANQQNDSENSNNEDNLTIKDFISLSLAMFKLKQGTPKPQSDLYLLQVIRQFNFRKIYSQIRENIRIQMNQGNIRVWSSKCGQDIKDESELREPVDKAADEIIQAYIELNNQGDFGILDKLTKEPNHQVIEFGLKMSYFDYYRQATQQFDKFITFFSHRISHYQEKMYQHLQYPDDKYQNLTEEQLSHNLISKLEIKLEENQNSLQFIKQEIGTSVLEQANKSNLQDKSEQTTQMIQEGPILLGGGIQKISKKLYLDRKNIGIKFKKEATRTRKNTGDETDFQSPNN